MHYPLSSYIVLHPPHFFTVVLQLNLDHKKLMIPENFIRDYGKFLSSSVSLKLADGMEWKVGLTRATNGAVWLQNGWHEFAEYYGLEFGSFLVFRFDGDSTFHTMIFDMNGSEIKYCCKFEDYSDGSLHGLKRQAKKEKASFPSLQYRKKMRNQDSFWPKMEPQEEEGYDIFRDIPSFKNKMPKHEDGVSMKMQPLDTKAELAAQKFSSKSEKPGFKVVMRQSNVGGRFDMIIPKEFAGKYLSEEFGMIRLQTSNGRTWSLVYKWSRNQGNFAYISSGWRRFAVENLLKEGDIGFFQLIQKDQFLFTKLQHSSSCPSHSPKNNKTTAAKTPFFEVDIGIKHYSNRILSIPKHFAKEHLSLEMHTAKLEVGKKQWKVKLKQYDNHFRFSAGWATFYKENRLEDTSCLFEMVNKKDCVFKVTIFNNISST